ncbi:hypothetical protein CAPTEDRAFT_191649 [Capitella teleta]|uniref:Uncharacterized protein n=1 Tax=Capitella teleta TaxID=283909 RepID=R7TDG2_CAPTE|nr:hypothetical protein CAPTEDRAFT_191649 [Capitella teleta]|eukprot:ELT91759.1 hypothetical protein CAPTEDRAFT_191649 [Capitella teleta]
MTQMRIAVVICSVIIYHYYSLPGVGFDSKDLRTRMYAAFGPDSDYEVEGTVTKDQLPISGPWRPGHLKAFVANFKNNEEITGSKDGPNGDAYAKLVPLVALYAGKPELEKYVIEATRMTHDNDLSVDCAIAAAKVLERLMLDGWTSKETPEQIVADVACLSPAGLKIALGAAIDAKAQTHKDAVQKFQSNCGLPQSLQTSLHAFLSAGFDTDFPSAIRPTLTACGDNLPRLMFAGACVGSRVGVDAIPKDWLDKTLKRDWIIQQANKLVSLREKK